MAGIGGGPVVMAASLSDRPVPKPVDCRVVFEGRPYERPLISLVSEVQ